MRRSEGEPERRRSDLQEEVYLEQWTIVWVLSPGHCLRSTYAREPVFQMMMSAIGYMPSGYKFSAKQPPRMRPGSASADASR